MTEQENRQYFNDPQMYSLLMNTRDEVIVAGRGVGKGRYKQDGCSSAFRGCLVVWGASCRHRLSGA